MSCNLYNLSVIDTVFVCLSSLCPVLILVNPISELIILRVPSLTLVTSKTLVIRPGPRVTHTCYEQVSGQQMEL